MIPRKVWSDLSPTQVKNLPAVGRRTLRGPEEVPREFSLHLYSVDRARVSIKPL